MNIQIFGTKKCNDTKTENSPLSDISRMCGRSGSETRMIKTIVRDTFFLRQKSEKASRNTPTSLWAVSRRSYSMSAITWMGVLSEDGHGESLVHSRGFPEETAVTLSQPMRWRVVDHITPIRRESGLETEFDFDKRYNTRGA